MPRTNVILFGESGGGKSSIVNMLSGGESVADTSSGAKGCTFESRAFEVNICGMDATLWDTAGLDEGEAGRVPKSDAIVQLYRLVRNLSDGVSLLMFVMRAPRIKSSVPVNWKLLHEVICQKNVPIVIVITGLEQEDNMDRWWWNNKGTFQSYGINPGGFACVTASRGKQKKSGYIFDEEYAESRDKIHKLIRSTCLTAPWRVPAAQWFKNITVEFVEYESRSCGRTKEVRRQEHREVVGDAFEKLVSVCGMSRSEAQELVNKVRGS
jgi:hypothetical protein